MWKSDVSYLHNKVTNCPAMTVSASVFVVGETLMLMVFQEQTFIDFYNFRLTITCV